MPSFGCCEWFMKIGIDNSSVIESEVAKMKKSFCVFWFVYVKWCIKMEFFKIGQWRKVGLTIKVMKLILDILC